MIIRSSRGGRKRKPSLVARVWRGGVVDPQAKAGSEIEADRCVGSFDLSRETFSFPPDLDLLAAVKPAVHPRDRIGRLADGLERDGSGPRQGVIVGWKTRSFRQKSRSGHIASREKASDDMIDSGERFRALYHQIRQCLRTGCTTS